MPLKRRERSKLIPSPAQLPCLSPKREAERVDAPVRRRRESLLVRPAHRRPQQVSAGRRSSLRLKSGRQAKLLFQSSQRSSKHLSIQDSSRLRLLHRRGLTGEAGQGGGARTLTVVAQQQPRSRLVSAGSGAYLEPPGKQVLDGALKSRSGSVVGSVPTQC